MPRIIDVLRNPISVNKIGHCENGCNLVSFHVFDIAINIIYDNDEVLYIRYDTVCFMFIYGGKDLTLWTSIDNPHSSSPLLPSKTPLWLGLGEDPRGLAIERQCLVGNFTVISPYFNHPHTLIVQGG
jgi:hypothetical protein